MIHPGLSCRFAVVFGLLVFPLNRLAATSLSVQFSAGSPGTMAQVAVNYMTDTDTPILQFDLLYNTNDLTSGNPVGGNALADHMVLTSEPSPGVRRVVFFSLSNALITNGVLAYMPFAIATNAADHNEPMTLSNVVVSDLLGEFVATTSSNSVLAIAVPPRFSAIFPTNGGAIHFELFGTTNRDYAIQSTTNLAQPLWTPIFTNIATAGVLKFDDVAASAIPAQFYRAVVVP